MALMRYFPGNCSTGAGFPLADCRLNQTRFRRSGGVTLLVPWLRLPVDNSVSTGKPQIVPAVLALVWEAVTHNKKNAAKFIAEVEC